MTWNEIGTLLGMLLAVALVLALAYGCTRLLARRGALLPGGGRGGRLRVLERLSLGREQSVVVAQIGVKRVLLGVTPAQITLLRELSGEEAALWDEVQKDGGPDGAARFQDALRAALIRKNHKGV